MLSIGLLGFIVWAFLVRDGLLAVERPHEITLLYAGTGLSFQSLDNKVFNPIEKSEKLPNQQETSFEGSSETNTQSPFNFENLKAHCPRHIKKYDSRFLEWFVGFTEGGGSFVVNNKTNRVAFCINQKDPKVLYYVRKNLGFGQVKEYGTYFRYSVTKKEYLHALIRLFAGNLILEKTNSRFAAWVKSYLVYYVTTPDVIDLVLQRPPGLRLSLNTAWLSGFIDAEGCFDGRWRNNKQQTLRLRFSIRQLGEPAMMTSLKKLAFSAYKSGTGVYWGSITAAETLQTFTVDTQCNIPLLSSYLNKFPLRSIKHIAFYKWQKLFNLTLMKSTNTLKLDRLRKSINALSKISKSTGWR